MKPGYTLSQVALARHLAVSAKWIRRQGETVIWRGEAWARMEYSNRRCAGYKLVTITP